MNAAKLQSAVSKLEKNTEAEESNLQTANKDFEKYSSAIEGLKNQLIGKTAESKTLEAQVKILVLADHSDSSEDTLRGKAEELSSEISRVKEQFEQMTGKINEHRLLKGSAAGAC